MRKHTYNDARVCRFSTSLILSINNRMEQSSRHLWQYLKNPYQLVHAFGSAFFFRSDRFADTTRMDNDLLHFGVDGCIWS